MESVIAKLNTFAAVKKRVSGHLVVLLSQGGFNRAQHRRGLHQWRDRDDGQKPAFALHVPLKVSAKTMR